MDHFNSWIGRAVLDALNVAAVHLNQLRQLLLSKTTQLSQAIDVLPKNEPVVLVQAPILEMDAFLRAD